MKNSDAAIHLMKMQQGATIHQRMSINKALGALEMRTPKEIVRMDKTKAICPNCGEEIKFTYWFSDRITFCDRCGQAVNWPSNK